MSITAISDFTYESVTRELKQQLNNTAQGVVYIGWLLRKAKDSEIYKEKYSTMTEYGQAEFGLSQSDVSRFIAINQKYSDGGNSPQLADNYAGFGSSKLVEMLTLQEEDVKVIDKDTTVSQIRELKHFEKAESEISESAEPVEQQFVTAFFTPSQKRPWDICYKQYQRCMQVLQEDQDSEYKERKIQEAVNPTRNSVFTGNSVFAFLKDRVIKVRRHGGNTYIDLNYLQLANLARLLFPAGLPEVELPRQEEEQQKEPEKKTESMIPNTSVKNVDNSEQTILKKESNPQKKQESGNNAISHKQTNKIDTKLEKKTPIEVLAPEDVEVIEPQKKKMQLDRIALLKGKQKETLEHIGDLEKFVKKADLTGIRSELQMLRVLLDDWERLQNER